MNRVQRMTIAGVLAASPWLLVAANLNDDDVSRIQKDLSALGYYAGDTDGDLDDPTRLAIARFQQDNGLQSTGEPDQQTLNSLAQAAGSTAVSAPAAAPAAPPDLPPIAEPSATARAQSSANGRDLDANDIRRVQGQLTELGYYQGSANGKMGDETSLSVARFQLDSGLTSTGVIDPATRNALNNAAAPQRASNQPATPARNIPASASANSNNYAPSSVRYAQRRLEALGFEPGPVDGVLSGQTQDALRAYQTQTDLPQTGKPDSATMQALLGSTNVAENTAASEIPTSDDDLVDALNERSSQAPFLVESGAAKPPNTRTLPLRETVRRPSPWEDPQQQSRATVTTQTYASQSTPPIQQPSRPISTQADPETVRYAQLRLAAYGYSLTPTGSFDSTTSAAISQFQTQAGLPATGQPDKATMLALTQGGSTSATAGQARQPAAYAPSVYPGAPLALAPVTVTNLDTDSARYIERRLQTLGHDPGPVDGVFTDQSRFALSAFQNNLGLQGTGQPDSATMQALTGSATYDGFGSFASALAATQSSNYNIRNSQLYSNAAFDVKPGSAKADRLRYARLRLIANGYLNEADAERPASVRAALAAYQSDAGLPTTGELNTETITALASRGFGVTRGSTYAASSIDDYVPPPALTPLQLPDYEQQRTELTELDRIELELRLTQLGYAPGSIDGILTAESSAAISAFQLDSGLPVSGDADRTTREYLQLTAGREQPVTSDTFTYDAIDEADDAFVFGPAPTESNFGFIEEGGFVEGDIIQGEFVNGEFVETGYVDSGFVDSGFENYETIGNNEFTVSSESQGEFLFGPAPTESEYTVFEGDFLETGTSTEFNNFEEVVVSDEEFVSVQASYPTKRLQKILAALRFYEDDIDGIMGENTTFALRAFQRQAGIPNRGTINEETVRELALYEWMIEPKTAVSTGYEDLTADETRRVEEALSALGYEPGKVDGELDHLAVMSIGLFQYENELPDSNGELDDATLKALSNKMRTHLGSGS